VLLRKVLHHPLYVCISLCVHWSSVKVKSINPSPTNFKVLRVKDSSDGQLEQKWKKRKFE
jgi:hypothetical protein